MKNEIQRAEVVGQKIVALFSTNKLVDGIDCTTIYFVLANKLVFVPPMPGHPWVREKLPWRRGRFDLDDPIIGHVISGVYGVMGEDGPDSESCLIRLDDGRWIHTCMCAPHGTGGTGLRVIAPEHVDETEQIDLWQLGTPYR